MSALHGLLAVMSSDVCSAWKRRPGDAGNHILLANALFELEDYEGARRSFDEALRLDPDAPEAHRGLAIVVMRARPGDRAAWNQARAHLEKVLAKNPKDRNAIVSVAQIVSENADRGDPEGYPAAQRDAEELLRRCRDRLQCADCRATAIALQLGATS